MTPESMLKEKRDLMYNPEQLLAAQDRLRVYLSLRYHLSSLGEGVVIRIIF
jgi:hypothetical protein